MPGQRLSIRNHLNIPSNTDHPPGTGTLHQNIIDHLPPVPGNRNQEPGII